MTLVTLRILEGQERGRIYSRLPTPIHIGREVDNHVQLNDDRVSRFHAKIQEDGGQVILTDLESTNGTRVNGHPVQMRVLQPGDLVMIGRCVMLFGDPRGWAPPPGEVRQTVMFDDEAPPTGSSDELEVYHAPEFMEPSPLFPQGAPPLPQGLRPLHRAQLSDLLAFLHTQLNGVLAQAQEVTPDDPQLPRTFVSPWGAWQDLVALQATVTGYLTRLAEPDDEV
jgi:hypothetical protein